MAVSDYISGISMTMVYTAIIIIPVVLIAILIIQYFRNKAIFKYKVRVWRIRDGGNNFKEANFKGGFIQRKNISPFFRIKTGKMWWQHVDLSTTPNPKHIDMEDRIYYIQLDVATYVQCKVDFDKGILNIIPVEPDVKYGAVLDIHRIKEILRIEPTWKKLLPYFGLIMMAIVFIVAYAILMNKCSGG